MGGGLARRLAATTRGDRWAGLPIKSSVRQKSDATLLRFKGHGLETVCSQLNTREKTVLRKTPKHDRPAGPRRILVVLTCLGLTCTFAYHAIYGRHGLETRSRLISRSAGLEFEIRGLEAVRARLRRDVALLSLDTPNADLVEEIARDVLGFVHPQDSVYSRDAVVR